MSPKAFPSYAQYNEDLILLALLYDIKKGFYVDVGANYPVVDSVTNLFYKKGWRGINIEPIPSLYKQLKEARPADTNLQIGVGDKEGELEFYENIHIPGHSSFFKDGLKEKDINRYKVDVKTLEQVFTENKVKDIHFLKIDVEGYEDPVVRGNDWKRFRPFVICIEANHRKQAWQETLKAKKYRLFISDGLNEYYIAEEEWVRTENFADRSVKLSYDALRQHQFESWYQDSKELKELAKSNQEHFEILQSLRLENERLQKYSLHNRSYLGRLKVGLYGLTIGWYRDLRNK
jgi:FkbM family methyltransferase